MCHRGAKFFLSNELFKKPSFIKENKEKNKLKKKTKEAKRPQKTHHAKDQELHSNFTPENRLVSMLSSIAQFRKSETEAL